MDPIKVEIVNDPSTGSIKPFEVWLHYPSGAKRRHKSFKHETKAKEAADKIQKRIDERKGA